MPLDSGQSRPLVLAMVTDAIHPYHLGGKETRTRQLATRLAASGIEVHVFTMNWWEGGRYVERDGVHYHALCRRYPLYSGDRRSMLEAVAFAAATFRLLSYHFDVLEVDHIPQIVLVPTRMVAWWRRVPLLSTWHEFWGVDCWREYLGHLGIFAGLLERLTLFLPDHIVTPSPETAWRLIENGKDRSRVTIVPNGIDRAAIDAATAWPRRIDVVFVGRLVSHKGAHVLIDALAILRDRDTVARCVIVGRGPERGALERQAAACGLSEAVQFLENLDDDELHGLVKASRVFVLPSVREGFGIAVAEALACGVPVVTTSHPDNHARSLVEEEVTGWLCEPTAASLAAALEIALSRAGGAVAADPALLARFEWQASITALRGVIEDSAARLPAARRRSPRTGGRPATALAVCAEKSSNGRPS